MVLRAGILMLDFGLVLARDLAQRRGRRVRDVWFDLRTARTMRQLATSVVGSIWSADAPIAYEMLTERRLEMRFGRIRSCYDNAQMTVGDYLRASCFVSQCEKKSGLRLTRQKVQRNYTKILSVPSHRRHSSQLSSCRA